MNNRKTIAFCLVRLLFSMPSCSSSEKPFSSSKVLLHKAEGIQSTVRLNSAEELNSLIRYEDCVVFVTKEGCSHCEVDIPVLNAFIEDSESVIYSIDYTVYKEAFEASSNAMGTYANLLPSIRYTPTYLFYQEGKLLQVKIPEKDYSYSELKEMLSSYTMEIPLYQLNDFSYHEEDGYTYLSNSEELEETKVLDTLGYSTVSLDKKIQEEKASVLYTWRRCNDCKDYRLYCFNDFLTKTDKKIYYYEVDGYYLLKRQSEESLRNLGLEMWASFSKRYHLISDSYYNTDVLGNKAGFAPTLVTYQRGSYSSMDVYLNETDLVENEDHTLSYRMTFHPEVAEFKSDTKVDSNDSSSKEKARKELASKARTYDLKASKEYLASL